MPKNSAKGKATNDKVTSKKSAAKGGKGESATEPDSDSSQHTRPNSGSNAEDSKDTKGGLTKKGKHD